MHADIPCRCKQCAGAAVLAQTMKALKRMLLSPCSVCIHMAAPRDRAFAGLCPAWQARSEACQHHRVAIIATAKPVHATSLMQMAASTLRLRQ